GIPQTWDFGVHQTLELVECGGDCLGSESLELLAPPVLVPSRFAHFPFAHAPIATSVLSPSLLTPVVRPSLLTPFLRSPGFAEHANARPGEETREKDRRSR